MKKIYIVIPIIFVIYIVCMCLLFADFSTKNLEGTYIVMDNAVFKYDQKEWLMDSSTDYTSYLFNVYIDNEYQGNYYLQSHNDKWYFFDENKKSQSLYGSLLAYKSEATINVLPFEINTASIDEVKTILDYYNITNYSFENLSLNKKLEFDFDNDGIMESVYAISNLSSNEAAVLEETFSILAYQKSNTIVDIVSEINTVDYFYTISNIIEFNNKKEYAIIISKDKYMNASMDSHCMYTYGKNNFTPLINC